MSLLHVDKEVSGIRVYKGGNLPTPDPLNHYAASVTSFPSGTMKPPVSAGSSAMPSVAGSALRRRPVGDAEARVEQRAIHPLHEAVGPRRVHARVNNITFLRILEIASQIGWEDLLLARMQRKLTDPGSIESSARRFFAKAIRGFGPFPAKVVLLGT